MKVHDLAALKRWNAWRELVPPGRVKPAKVPFGVAGQMFESDDPDTWLTLAEAQALDQAMGPRDAGRGGVGIGLGPLEDGSGRVLAGVDLDSCIGDSGMSDWAVMAIAAFGGVDGGAGGCYAEISPSGTGVKLFAVVPAGELDAVRAVLGIAEGKWGRGFKRAKAGKGSGGRGAGGSHPPSTSLPSGSLGARTDAAHPPGIEVYLALRYFTVTGDRLDADVDDLGILDAGSAERLMAGAVTALLGKRPEADPDAGGSDDGSAGWDTGGVAVPREQISGELAKLAELRPMLKAVLNGDTTAVGSFVVDQSGSGWGLGLFKLLRDAGWDYASTCLAALEASGPAGDWARGTDGRQLRRTWRKAAADGKLWNLALARPIVADDGAVGGASGGGENDPSGGGGGGGGGDGAAGGDDGGTAAPPARPADWTDMLQVGKNKEWRSNLHNALVALRHAPEWQGMFAYDRFADRIMVRRCPPYQTEAVWQRDSGPEGRLLCDDDMLGIAAWTQARGLQIVAGVALEAVTLVARDNQFDPVRDYLESVEKAWDGRRRLDMWLVDYLGCADTPYVRAVASMTLIGAVARAMVPGCKMDTVGILEGRQGMGKSTALRVLFGADRFVDHMPELTSKDAQLQLAGKWCVEFAELDKLNKAEASRAKAFISTQIDNYRRPYGRIVESIPRRSVCWGTVNPDMGCGYLTDETGNRRFWPVRCGEQFVDAAALARGRDMIWAEATARWRAGEAWWMTGDLESAQTEEVAARQAEDSWTPQVRRFLENITNTSIGEIFEQALRKPIGDCDRRAEIRIGRILTLLGGWQKYRAKFKDGSRESRYVRTSAVIVPFPRVTLTPENTP